VNGNENLDLWGDFELAGSSAVGLTVMRTIVQLWLLSPLASDTITVGLLVDDKTNVGTSVALASQRNLDWMWRTLLVPVSSGATVDANQAFPRDGRGWDIRSKRRTNDIGRTCMLCFSGVNSTIRGVQFTVSQLVALP